MNSNLTEFVNLFYSHFGNFIVYDESYNRSKQRALAKLREWNSDDALSLCLWHAGIKLKDNEVLTLVANMLKKKKFGIFFLAINNYEKKYNSSELALIENVLLKNVSENVQMILYFAYPSTDVCADWIQRINMKYRIEYYCFAEFSFQLSPSNEQKILGSFQQSDCKTKGIDVSGLYSSASVDSILRFFSEQNHQLDLLRVRGADNYTSALHLESAAKIAASNSLLPDGIHWDREWNNQWITFNFTPEHVQAFRSLKAGNEAHGERRARVFILGDKGVGKTSTVRTLLGLRFEKKPSQTHNGCFEMEEKMIINHDPNLNWVPGEVLKGDEAQLEIFDFKDGKRAIVLETLLMAETSIFVGCFRLEDLLTRETQTIADLCAKVKILQDIAPQAVTLLVATHAHGARTVELKKLSLSFMKALGKAKLRVIFNSSSKLAFHLLENSTALISTKDQVLAIKATLSKIIFDFPEFHIKIPRWIPTYLNILTDIFKNEKAAVTMGSVLHHARTFCLPPDEVDIVLQWGHRLGSLLYIGSDSRLGSRIRPYAVFNMDSLFQTYEKIIYDAEANSKCFNEMGDALKQGIMEYETEGILYPDVLYHFTNDLDEQTRELVVDVSLFFGVMLKPEDPLTGQFQLKLTNPNCFVVPSMMPNWTAIVNLESVAQLTDATDCDTGVPVAELIP